MKYSAGPAGSAASQALATRPPGAVASRLRALPPSRRYQTAEKRLSTIRGLAGSRREFSRGVVEPAVRGAKRRADPGFLEADKRRAIAPMLTPPPGGNQELAHGPLGDAFEMGCDVAPVRASGLDLSQLVHQRRGTQCRASVASLHGARRPILISDAERWSARLLSGRRRIKIFCSSMTVSSLLRNAFRKVRTGAVWADVCKLTSGPDPVRIRRRCNENTDWRATGVYCFCILARRPDAGCAGESRCAGWPVSPRPFPHKVNRRTKCTATVRFIH